MFARVLAGVAVSFVVVLASCSDSGLLSPLNDKSNQITISSVADGTIVTQGQTIPLSVDLNSSQSTPTDLKVELLSATGDVVQTANIKNVDFSAPLPAIELSSLSDGTYTMRLTLYGDTNNVLAQEKVDIFYVKGAYSLDGITSYPPTLLPGGSGIIVARVTAPTGANPYLRWSMGDKLIAAGYLKDGLDKIQWDAPSSAGVYSIMVELFPYGPPPGGSFDFTSPYKMKVEVFVSASAKAGRNELGPSSSYYALFHFQGNLKDSSARSKGLEATPIGNPTLSVNGSVFGYQLDGSSGFSFHSLMLPFDSTGNLEPASITLRFRLDKLQPGRQFFKTVTSDGSFSLDVGTNSNGLLTASVNGTAAAGGVELSSGDVTTVTLSLVPTDGALSLLWFVNGALTLHDSLPVYPRINTTSGTSTIGGANGFTGLLDEFGVYYKDPEGNNSTDPEVFRRAMVDEYGSNLVFAEGFDGLYLPTDLSYDGDVKSSQLVEGMLLLSSGQSVLLPKTSLGEDTITVTVALAGLSEKASGSLKLTENGKQVYSVPLKDAIDPAGRVELELKKSGAGIVVTAGGHNPTTIGGESSDVDVGIASTGTGPVSLRSVLMVRNRAQLANKGVSGSKPSNPET